MMQPALAPAPHPSMHAAAQDPSEQVLQEHLLAVQQAQQQLASQHANARQQQQGAHHMSQGQGPRGDQNNIDPAIAGTAGLSGPQETQSQSEEQDLPKTYGKRPLSTSKRAAQNRAAQRAFRQRKETYIRKLEQQVKEAEAMSERYAQLQAENYQLREYIINLQSRLLDSQGEIPELPSNIDLSQARADLAVAGPGGRPTAGSGVGTVPVTQQAPPATTGTDLSSLNHMAVAGLGMRSAKRMARDQNEQSDNTKSELSHGIAVVP